MKRNAFACSATRAGATGALFAAMCMPALALSELPEEDIAPSPDVLMVPLPPPLPNPANRPLPITPQPSGETDTGEEQEQEPALEGNEADIPTPEIRYDVEALPEPVRQTRALILEACRRGDVEALRPLIMASPGSPTQLSLGPLDGDRVDFLREISGDDQGHEILAILQEVLEAGFVHLEPGTNNEIYVWPYFFSVPLDTLTAPQRVELFRLVTAGDYEEMKAFGAYIFYRVGIRPDGSWVFFVAGD